MTATRNDDCHNHLCLPVLSVEGAVSVLLDSPLRKKEKKKKDSAFGGNPWDCGGTCCLESRVKREQTSTLRLEWPTE